MFTVKFGVSAWMKFHIFYTNSLTHNLIVPYLCTYILYIIYKFRANPMVHKAYTTVFLKLSNVDFYTSGSVLYNAAPYVDIQPIIRTVNIKIIIL